MKICDGGWDCYTRNVELELCIIDTLRFKKREKKTSYEIWLIANQNLLKIQKHHFLIIVCLEGDLMILL